MSRPAASAQTNAPLRILAASNLWQGANDYAFVRAFRRMGHSVRAINEREFLPAWQNKGLKVMRKVLGRRMVKDYNAALLREAQMLKPNLFFVFKGAMIKPETLKAIKRYGAVCIQFYPDVSIHTHGPYLPETLQEYDWIFNTKSFGVRDLAEQLGMTQCSFLPHAFDPETHTPITCSHTDITQYACDLSFIGNHSEKKWKVLANLRVLPPGVSIKIWGPKAWSCLPNLFQGAPVYGYEYAKAIQLSKINLALLSEQRSGASSGDLITARTFEIPGAGGFMLHERTPEAETYFKDGKECVFFDDGKDLADKIRYYLSHDKERRQIANAGRQRCLTSGYSTDDRARVVIEKYHTLIAEA